LPPADRTARDAALALARASLGRTEFERHWSAGESTPLERIVDAALAARPIATPSESLSDAHVVLSAREREVAELIAEGLSNREIAERLVIAPRTAEAHVTHVLTKLGLRSRAQVAVWVVSQSSPR
jgi:non-specific serine/threonine protein kinase